MVPTQHGGVEKKQGGGKNLSRISRGLARPAWTEHQGTTGLGKLFSDGPRGNTRRGNPKKVAKKPAHKGPGGINVAP